jgi:hypothetical protein
MGSCYGSMHGAAITLLLPHFQWSLHMLLLP